MSRIAARLVLPVIAAAAVFGGTVVSASAEPTTPQSPQEGQGLVDGLLGGLLGGIVG
jgi:hypothetical protein